MNVVSGLLGALAVMVAGPALSPLELANLLSVARRWMARAGLALWPDVKSDGDR